MVIPWDGFPLSKLIALADPKPEAKYVSFTTFNDPKNVPGQRSAALDWPYFEGLRLDEAQHPGVATVEQAEPPDALIDGEPSLRCAVDQHRVAPSCFNACWVVPSHRFFCCLRAGRLAG